MGKAPLRIMLKHWDDTEAHPVTQIPLWIKRVVQPELLEICIAHLATPILVELKERT